MARKQYWLTLIPYLVVVVVINVMTIGRLSAIEFNTMLFVMYGALGGLVGKRFNDMGFLSRWGYLPVFACGLGAILLGYVANHSLFEVEHPILTAVLFHLFVFGPLVLAGAAGIPGSDLPRSPQGKMSE